MKFKNDLLLESKGKSFVEHKMFEKVTLSRLICIWEVCQP